MQNHGKQSQAKAGLRIRRNTADNYFFDDF